MADFQVMYIPLTSSSVVSYPGAESKDLQKFPLPQTSFLFQLHILKGQIAFLHLFRHTGNITS